jgi:molecular chaperone GrpE (heat shock protein)
MPENKSFTDQKLEAEINLLKAETERCRAETERIRADVEKIRGNTSNEFSEFKEYVTGFLKGVDGRISLIEKSHKGDL